MTKILVNSVWANVVKHYYTEIHDKTTHTIWSWIEDQYNGKCFRGGYDRLTGIDVVHFVFDNDIDANAFKLKFM